MKKKTAPAHGSVHDTEFLQKKIAELNSQLAALSLENQLLQKQISVLSEEKTDAIRNLQDIQNRNEFLSQENIQLQNRFKAEEHKLDRLCSWAENIQQQTDNSAYIADLERKERILRHLISSFQNFLAERSPLLSFRTARLMQIFRHPVLIGESSRLMVFLKILSNHLAGKPFKKDYQIFQEAQWLLADGLARVNTQLPQTATLPADLDTEAPHLISVILPVYNQADLVHESIESVLAQTYKNWELIIVNDGSTDHLSQAVAPYLSDQRIFYFEQANQKLPKALSNGFSFARGEYLTWTSADNNMHPQMLSKLAAFLHVHPQTDMVYADYEAIDDKGEPLTASWFRPQNKRHPNSPELHLPRTTELLNIVQDNFIGASFMYRRSTLKLIGDYDPQLGVEDYDYWMRINSLLKISHLGSDDILYSYRVHDNSLNAQAAELKILDKCQKLMTYEKERYAFYFKEFNIYSSFLETDLLYGRFNYHFHPGRYEGNAHPDTHEKRILLCRGCELHTFSPEELGRYSFIGVYFDIGMANDAGKNAYKIRRFQIRCYARPGSVESQRLRVLTPHLLECEPPQMGFYALAGANNKIFFESTRTQEERTRTLPLFSRDPGKILVLLEGVGNGGMEQVAYDMVRSFRKQGRLVSLASFQEPGENVSVPEDISLYVLNADDPEEALAQLLEKEKYEAVFAHYCTRGAQKAHRLQIPYYQIIHNTYVWFGEKEIRDYTEADPYTTAYIAVSANVAWYAMECMALSPEKMVIIENAVELQRFEFSEEQRQNWRRKWGIADDEFLFLNPASFYGTKGQLNLILAFAQAYKRNSKLRLLVAGKIFEQKYYEDVQNIIRENGLENAVMIGQFFDDMAGIYSASDAVVLASFWEGCSLAVAETIHMRKPLLATRVGDVERQTDCKNCFLFDLPFHYLTELTGKNYGTILYTPNQHMIDSLAYGMLTVAIGDYPTTDTLTPLEQSADEVYARYLKLLNYSTGKVAVEAFRHNI